MKKKGINKADVQNSEVEMAIFFICQFCVIFLIATSLNMRQKGNNFQLIRTKWDCTQF